MEIEDEFKTEDDYDEEALNMPMDLEEKENAIYVDFHKNGKGKFARYKEATISYLPQGL